MIFDNPKNQEEAYQLSVNYMNQEPYWNYEKDDALEGTGSFNSKGEFLYNDQVASEQKIYQLSSKSGFTINVYFGTLHINWSEYESDMKKWIEEHTPPKWLVQHLKKPNITDGNNELVEIGNNEYDEIENNELDEIENNEYDEIENNEHDEVENNELVGEEETPAHDISWKEVAEARLKELKESQVKINRLKEQKKILKAKVKILEKIMHKFGIFQYIRRVLTPAGLLQDLVFKDDEEDRDE